MGSNESSTMELAAAMSDEKPSASLPLQSKIVDSVDVIVENLSSTNYKDLNELRDISKPEPKSNEEAIDISDERTEMEEETGEDSATESLPPTTEELAEEPHDRSDGSDSGLGSELSEERPQENAAIIESDSETSFLYRLNEGTITNTQFEEFASQVALPRCEEDSQIESDIGDILSGTQSKSPKPSKSSLKRKLPTDDHEQPEAKKRRGITFDSVTVFYFPRAQGFTCVPSQGGSTLGMGAQHSHFKKFSLSEHALEQRRIHRQLLQQLRSERNATVGTVVSSSEESDSEDEPSDASESEMDLDNYYFLQPVPTRQRRALLRSAGVRKIDALEKDECRDIRSSREFCGCGCKGYCDPDTCSCSQAGIKCQVDRLNFPCGCSRDNCGNSSGRIEFNPVRVRTHFIHTLMRLELEKEKEDMKSDNKETDAIDNDRLNSSEKEVASKSSVNKFNSNLLRDVTLGANVEVENCVHIGSYTNLHYGAPGEGPGHNPPGFSNLPDRADSLDLYTFRENCYAEVENSAVERKQAFPVAQGFHFPDPRFSDVGFPASGSPYPSPSNQYTQPYPSSFGDFSPVFNPYGGIYPPDFATKPIEGSFPQTYEHFSSDTFSAGNVDSKENQYTSLNSVGANNKIESFTDLLTGKYNSYSGAEESANFNSVSTGQTSASNEKTEKSSENAENAMGECDENFGEIIKKSMVETVSA
nr:uncharacterized protein LOC111513945 [Leptinotarsa decemlineata]XP_023025947.1 uncharacterized protein LOC111513945 [Leptinotarsa decemlineata]XP_023025954.1 uncharacterized protein LOC111513945 [Leptinotarsa decemlineata]